MANSLFVETQFSFPLPGGQIQFPATDIVSTAPNVLDDYTEFNWTPTLTGSGGQSGITYSIQAGHGVKIGSLVACWARIQLSAMTSITGNVQLSLPYTSSNFSANAVSSAFSGAFVNLGSSVVRIGGNIAPNTSIMLLNKLAAAGASVANLLQADITATVLFDYSAIYRTDA